MKRDRKQFEPVLKHKTKSADNDGRAVNAAEAGTKTEDAVNTVHDEAEVLASGPAQQGDSIILSIIFILHSNRRDIHVLKKYLKCCSDC